VLPTPSPLPDRDGASEAGNEAGAEAEADAGHDNGYDGNNSDDDGGGGDDDDGEPDDEQDEAENEAKLRGRKGKRDFETAVENSNEPEPLISKD